MRHKHRAMAAPPAPPVPRYAALADFEADIRNIIAAMPAALAPAVVDPAAINGARDGINAARDNLNAAVAGLVELFDKLRQERDDLTTAIDAENARLQTALDDVARAQADAAAQRAALAAAVADANRAQQNANAARRALATQQQQLQQQSDALGNIAQQVEARTDEARRLDALIESRTTQIRAIEESGALADQVAQLRNELRLERQARYAAEHSVPGAQIDYQRLRALEQENERLRDEVGRPLNGPARITPSVAAIGAASAKLTGQTSVLANASGASLRDAKARIATLRDRLDALHTDYGRAGTDADKAALLAAFDGAHAARNQLAAEAERFCDDAQNSIRAVAQQIDNAQKELAVSPADRFNDALSSLIARRSVSVGDVRSPEHLRLLVSLVDQRYMRISQEVTALQQTLATEARSSAANRNLNVLNLLTAIAFRYGGQQLQAQNGTVMYAFATEADARAFGDSIAVSGAATTLRLLDSGVDMPWLAVSQGWAR